MHRIAFMCSRAVTKRRRWSHHSELWGRRRREATKPPLGEGDAGPWKGEKQGRCAEVRSLGGDAAFLLHCAPRGLAGSFMEG